MFAVSQWHCDANSRVRHGPSTTRKRPLAIDGASTEVDCRLEESVRATRPRANPRRLSNGQRGVAEPVGFADPGIVEELIDREAELHGRDLVPADHPSVDAKRGRRPTRRPCDGLRADDQMFSVFPRAAVRSVDPTEDDAGCSTATVEPLGSATARNFTDQRPAISLLPADG